MNNTNTENNKVTIAGTIITNPDFSHEVYGEKFYIFKLEVKRLSENADIIPITICSNDDTLRIAEKLRSEGYYIPAIRPPTVPEGTSRLRLSLTADSKKEDIETVFKIIHES